MMTVDIQIEVYEYGPHGHGGECTIDDWMEVSEEAYEKIKEFYAKDIDDLEEMNIPELREKLDAIYEEHTDFARDRFFGSGGEEEDFSSPSITVRVSYIDDEEE